uniref:non-specific serine/threonine protein kinase n=1 Tax=Cyprinus carpio TaxID=7962 RepID=A0A8C2C8A9_CYPCA
MEERRKRKKRASGGGQLSAFLGKPLNTIWLKQRISTRLKPDHIGHLAKLYFILTAVVYLLIGLIRSHYKIGSKLGQGGFGFVYEGTRCKDELKVSISFTYKTLHISSELMAGIPMEIGLTLMANKIPRAPEIIKILDWEDNEDHFIMVMERPMPCMDLKSFVKLHGESLDEGTARNIMRQVIEAANVCVKRGVFHRDIKMENLLVNQDTMEVKLIDFGCGAQMKRFGYDVFSGTKAYCPPEVTVNGKYHAKPTTVWSLGILLFMMACGYYPTEYDLDLISKRSWTRPDQRVNLIDLEKMHMHDCFVKYAHCIQRNIHKLRKRPSVN